jgi:hypothetical protein
MHMLMQVDTLKDGRVANEESAVKPNSGVFEALIRCSSAFTCMRLSSFVDMFALHGPQPK